MNQDFVVFAIVVVVLVLFSRPWWPKKFSGKSAGSKNCPGCMGTCDAKKNND